MAAAEYYLGTQGAAELSSHNLPQHPPQNQPTSILKQPPAQPYPPQQHNIPFYSNAPPPQQNQQIQPYTSPQPYPGKGAPAVTAPYPVTPPSGPYYVPPPQNQNGYLGAPIRPVRSHSQPPRVRFADQESNHSTSDSSDSDSESSSRRRRHRRHRSHDRARERDSDRDSDYSDQERRHRSKTHRKEQRDRDTFLGAGAGGIIGDAIFPGLGTAAGLLLGGIGGRKYASRSKSEEPPHHHRHRDSRDEGRRDREWRRRDGYD